MASTAVEYSHLRRMNVRLRRAAEPEGAILFTECLFFRRVSNSVAHLNVHPEMRNQLVRFMSQVLGPVGYAKDIYVMIEKAEVGAGKMYWCIFAHHMELFCCDKCNCASIRLLMLPRPTNSMPVNQPNHMTTCTIPSCGASAFDYQYARQADKYGPPGIRCANHIDPPLLCNAMGCENWGIMMMDLPEGDQFGGLGMRCRTHWKCEIPTNPHEMLKLPPEAYENGRERCSEHDGGYAPGHCPTMVQLYGTIPGPGGVPMSPADAQQLHLRQAGVSGALVPQVSRRQRNSAAVEKRRQILEQQKEKGGTVATPKGSRTILEAGNKNKSMHVLVKEKKVKYSYFNYCTVPDCNKRSQGNVRVADKYGAPGRRCAPHGGGSRCNVEECTTYGQKKVQEADQFGKPGPRCRMHGGIRTYFNKS